MSIVSAYRSCRIGTCGNVCGLRERTQCVNQSCVLHLLRNLEIGYCKFFAEVSNLCVFCVAFHLAKFVENFLSVARSVRGDCAGVLCVFEANVVDVAICFAAALLSSEAVFGNACVYCTEALAKVTLDTVEALEQAGVHCIEAIAFGLRGCRYEFLGLRSHLRFLRG